MARSVNSLLFMFILHNVIEAHKVLIHPRDQSVLNGTRAVLRCEFDEDATPCKWSRDGILIAFEYYPKDQYDLIKERRNGNCTLIISQVNFSRDDGQWVCFMQQTPTNEAVSADPANLQVVVIPEGPELKSGDKILKPGSNLVLSAGNLLEISCKTRNGNPESVLHWQLNNQSLKPPTENVEDPKTKLYHSYSTLVLNITKEMNEFNLTCESRLGPHIPIAQTYIILCVRYRTSHVHLTHELNTQVKEGHRVSLVCKADGNPPPVYQWMKLKENSNQWKVISVSPIYTIYSASTDDEGYYLCMAGNNGIKIPSEQTHLKIIKNDVNKSEIPVVLTAIVGVSALCAIIIFLFVHRNKKKNHQVPLRQQVTFRQQCYLDMKPISRPPLPSLPVDAHGYLIPSAKQLGETNQYMGPDPSTPNISEKGRDSINSATNHVYDTISMKDYLYVLPPMTKPEFSSSTTTDSVLTADLYSSENPSDIKDPTTTAPPDETMETEKEAKITTSDDVPYADTDA